MRERERETLHSARASCPSVCLHYYHSATITRRCCCCYNSCVGRCRTLYTQIGPNWTAPLFYTFFFFFFISCKKKKKKRTRLQWLQATQIPRTAWIHYTHMQSPTTYVICASRCTCSAPCTCHPSRWLTVASSRSRKEQSSAVLSYGYKFGQINGYIVMMVRCSGGAIRDED